MSAVGDPGVLAGVALFRGLPEAALQELARRLHRRTFQAGTSVLTAEQPGEVLYVILSGTVKISLDEPGGGEVTFAFLGPGDSFGELSLLDRSGRSANAVTLEESELLWMEGAAFRECLRAHPELYENLVRELAGRLRAANRQIHALAALDVRGRVARQLLALAERYSEGEAAGEIRIPLALNQRELAASVGATRERVNRVLVALRRQGAIAVDARHRITVRDREALRREGLGAARAE